MREGKRFRTAHLEVRLNASPLVLDGTAPALRVGIIVPKFTHTAVSRNRVKRRLRELVRHSVLQSGIQGLMVIRARTDAYEASFAALREDVDALLKECGKSRSAVL
jgi:ribonuclease P protein component